MFRLAQLLYLCRKDPVRRAQWAIYIHNAVKPRDDLLKCCLKRYHKPMSNRLMRARGAGYALDCAFCKHEFSSKGQRCCAPGMRNQASRHEQHSEAGLASLGLTADQRDFKTRRARPVGKIRLWKMWNGRLSHAQCPVCASSFANGRAAS